MGFDGKKGHRIWQFQRDPTVFIIREQGQTNSLLIAVFTFGATFLKRDFSERYLFLPKHPLYLCMEKFLPTPSSTKTPPSSDVSSGNSGKSALRQHTKS